MLQESELRSIDGLKPRIGAFRQAIAGRASTPLKLQGIAKGTPCTHGLTRQS